MDKLRQEAEGQAPAAGYPGDREDRDCGEDRTTLDRFEVQEFPSREELQAAFAVALHVGGRAHQQLDRLREENARLRQNAARFLNQRHEVRQEAKRLRSQLEAAEGEITQLKAAAWRNECAICGAAAHPGECFAKEQGFSPREVLMRYVREGEAPISSGFVQSEAYRLYRIRSRDMLDAIWTAVRDGELTFTPGWLLRRPAPEEDRHE